MCTAHVMPEGLSLGRPVAGRVPSWPHGLRQVQNETQDAQRVNVRMCVEAYFAPRAA